MLKKYLSKSLSAALILSAFALPVQAGAPPTLEVSTMEQLIRAIGPHRTIRLKPGIYRISPDLQSSPFIRWSADKKPTLTLSGVQNLKIIGSGVHNTFLVNDRCSAPVLDFDNVKHLRLQNLSFAHMLDGESTELDCTPGVRELAQLQAQPLRKNLKALQRWQKLARDIVRGGSQGVELPEYTAPLYPNVLRQVREESRPISAEHDALETRRHSLRPRVGKGYVFRPQGIFSTSGQRAQAAAVVFDRSENLVVVLDRDANLILALEARNNTRRAWTHSEDWMMRHSIVPESNAPSPNGIYAMGRPLKDSPTRGPTFGSYRILIEGGMPTQRQILFHSRDNRMTREIPWNVDSNQENSRTLGCVLMQDHDLMQLARLVQTAEAPIALVMQGRYAKNLKSPATVLDLPSVRYASAPQVPTLQSEQVAVTASASPTPEPLLPTQAYLPVLQKNESSALSSEPETVERVAPAPSYTPAGRREMKLTR